MSSKLTTMQLAYRDNRISGKNPTQSARLAGYKHPTKKGYELDRKPEIATLVEAKQKAATEQAGITAEKVLNELWRVASLDIRQAFEPDGSLKRVQDMPADVAHAISGMEVEELFVGGSQGRRKMGFTKRIRFCDKVRALELCGRHVKLFDELSPLSGIPMVINIVPANNLPARDTSH